MACVANRLHKTKKGNKEAQQKAKILRITIVLPLSPYTKLASGFFSPALVLLTRPPMMELKVIDVEASNVDAMMLFRNVCTANIPFLAPSVIIVCTQTLLLRWLTPTMVVSG